MTCEQNIRMRVSRDDESEERYGIWKDQVLRVTKKHKRIRARNWSSAVQGSAFWLRNFPFRFLSGSLAGHLIRKPLGPACGLLFCQHGLVGPSVGIGLCSRRARLRLDSRLRQLVKLVLCRCVFRVRCLRRIVDDCWGRPVPQLWAERSSALGSRLWPLPGPQGLP